MKVVVLLSGGIDSTCAAYLAKAEGKEIHALTINYGHKALAEIEAAKQTAQKICDTHKVLDLSVLKEIWTSPLIDTEIKESENDRKGDSYYVVPLRNIVFLSIAAAYAETIGAKELYIGNHADDTQGFPDCKHTTMLTLQTALDFGSEEGKKVRIISPWQWNSKVEIIAKGVDLNVPFEDTYSCYKDGPACGVCEACKYRLGAFKEVNLKDPIAYE